MKNILLIDDSKLILKLLENKVRQNNLFKVYTASSYKEAKVQIESGIKFFVSVNDLNLPDSISGEVVDLTIEHGIPTIVLSSTLNDKMRKEVLKKDIVDYITKSDRDEISSVIDLAENLLYLKGKKVLIIGESKIFRSIFNYYFRSLLFNCFEVTNAKDAYDILDNDEDIKITVIANNFKDASGIDIVKQIRKNYSKENIIFGVTSSMDDEIKYKFLKSGANDCLVSPVLKEEFNVRVINTMKLFQQQEKINDYIKTVDKYIISSETNEFGKITHASEAFKDISGYSEEELIGHTHSMLRHPDVDDEIYQDLWNTINDKKSWTGEIKNRKKDGSFYWVRSHIDPILDIDGDLSGYRAIREDITDKILIQNQKKEIEEIQKNLRDSIKFSSMIQNAILPHNDDMDNFFKNYFMLWKPKDVVGGDVYQFILSKDGNNNEALIFVIDCTGHGVPGAFMTMIVKSLLETTVTTDNFNNPAKIMQLLNINIKKTLRQDREETENDAGFDGGIAYINKETKKVFFCGSKTPIFIVKNGEIEIQNGDRMSVGYKRSKEDFEFTNYEFTADDETYYYITTDGFLDQNGGPQEIPYGKKKFKKLLLENYEKPFPEQKNIFYDVIKAYQGDYLRNDDITMCGFKV